MIYITGDTHRDFGRIERFCARMDTSIEDILIILGDAGINYYGGKRDRDLKHQLAKLPLTLFSIHGNHEQRPASIHSYHTMLWNEGEVYVEDDYPNLLFAVDGSYYSFDGVQTFTVGGAYSVDKYYRLANGWGWWPPGRLPRQDLHGPRPVRRSRGHPLPGATPLRYEPVEVFMSCVDQSRVDKSTEEWLGTIERRLQYKRWYCGHYHTEKAIDRMVFMFESIRAFPSVTALGENEK